MDKIRLAVKFILKFLKWFLISLIILITFLIVATSIMNWFNKAPEYVNPYKDIVLPYNNDTQATSSDYRSWSLIKTFSGNATYNFDSIPIIDEDFSSSSFTVNSEKLLMVAEVINISSGADFELFAYINPINITDSSEALDMGSGVVVENRTNNPAETTVTNIKRNLKYQVILYSSHQWKVKIYEWD